MLTVLYLFILLVLTGWWEGGGKIFPFNSNNWRVIPVPVLDIDTSYRQRNMLIFV